MEIIISIDQNCLLLFKREKISLMFDMSVLQLFCFFKSIQTILDAKTLHLL